MDSAEGNYDVIVVGLGAIGSAAAYQLAKRGSRILGIDQFSPPHVYGSSQGDSRITRQAIGEGTHYSPFAIRSCELWREIEKESGKDLLEITGCLLISQSAESEFFRNTLLAATEFNIRHDVLTAGEIRERFPQFNVQDSEVGYYEYDAGYLRPEECIQTQLALAEKCGAEIHRNEKVERFTDTNGVVTVETDSGTYTCNRLILAAGPWLPQLMGKNYEDIFTVLRQVLYWFKPKGGVEPYTSTHFPVFLWELGAEKQGMYGFPALDGETGGVKVANHQFGTPTTAEAINREVSPAEIEEMYNTFVAPYLPGLSSECVRAVPCLYTNTPDFGFIVDTHPEYSSVIVASPCSGHGFKHSAAIGEALAELVTTGRTTLDITPFSIGRFLNAARPIK